RDGDEGPIYGTPAYLAPEVIRGEVPDAKADIYALGMVLYLAASGAHPFDGKGVRKGDVLRAHLEDPLPPLRVQRPGLARSFANAIESCASKEAHKRPPAEELLALLEGHPEWAREPGAVPAVAPAPRRAPKDPAAAGAAAAAAGASLAT